MQKNPNSPNYANEVAKLKPPQYWLHTAILTSFVKSNTIMMASDPLYIDPLEVLNLSSLAVSH